MADTLPAYPRRSRFFANHFVRVMAKACVANALGPEGCWLITLVALTEDAKGYREPVTFFNEQLLPLAGLKNVKALDRVRAKAVAAGWLVYLPGGKGKAGRYWVDIPAPHRNWDDAPTDERDDSAGYSVAFSPKEPGENRERSGEESGREPGENRERSGQHSSLSQDNLFLPQEPPTPAGRVLGPDADQQPTRGPTPDEAVGVWNAQPALPRITASDPHRDTAIRSRAFDAQWAEHWRPVIEYMGRTAKYCGKLDGWRPSLAWLLKRGNFASVLDEMRNEGTAPPAGGPPPARDGPAMTMHELMEKYDAKRAG